MRVIRDAIFFKKGKDFERSPYSFFIHSPHPAATVLNSFILSQDLSHSHLQFAITSALENGGGTALPHLATYFAFYNRQKINAVYSSMTYIIMITIFTSHFLSP